MKIYRDVVPEKPSQRDTIIYEMHKIMESKKCVFIIHDRKVGCLLKRKRTSSQKMRGKMISQSKQHTYESCYQVTSDNEEVKEGLY